MDNQEKINQLESDLTFYKSLFETHQNSCIFNLHIKTIQGEKVWVDRVRDTNMFHLLDKDEEVKEWLQPVKCSR